MRFVKNLVPEKGDILRVQRPLGYYHFGIYADNGEVIHFSGANSDSVNDSKNVSIIKTSFERFEDGDQVEVNADFDSPFTRDEIVERAMSFLGQKTPGGKPYNFITHNCEHFANYCYYGRNISNQVINGAISIADSLGIKLNIFPTKK